jgi:hypothetical protein
VYPADAWLSGVLPVNARRFRVWDTSLAEKLRAAGAEIDERGVDVEIAPHGEMLGHAPLAIVTAEASASGAHRLVRAGKRLRNSIRIRSTAARARRALRARGYETTTVILWDVLHPLRLPWAPGEKRRRRMVERLPQRALILGMRSARPRTILEAAAADAARAANIDLDLDGPVVRAEVLLLVGAEGVLRIAVGPSRQEIERQVAVLERLHAANVPPSVADRVPQLLARGKSGLADWSLERRLPGKTPARRLSAAVLGECVDFLVDLHSVRGSGAEGSSCAERAAVLAELCATEHVRALADLGCRLDAVLSALPRGFGHADFGRGNLLVEGERLVGVVDWDGAGSGQLPLLSLIHLRLGAAYDPQDKDWGHTIVSRLLPWADAGGDEIARGYCRRVGFEPSPKLLRALALAFWLDLVTLHLRLHPIRRDDRSWISRNVDGVIEALAAGPDHLLTRRSSGNSDADGRRC